MGAKRKASEGVKKRVSGGAAALAPHENPLVRNETLRQMYQKMVEARVLEEHVLRRLQKTKLAGRLESSQGQEACRAGLLQELTEGDVVMDSQDGGLTGHLLGVKLPVVLRGAQALTSGQAANASDILLPFVEGAEARLFAAVGAGLLMRSEQKKGVVVVYVPAREVAKSVWRQVLKFAATHDLPVVFVVLPKAAKRTDKSSAARVCGLSSEFGVPGIPVDACDAVALYRMAQESMGRIRGGGGPVLIECIAYRVDGEKPRVEDDPIAQLRGFLLGRKVLTEAWMEGVERRFRKRLEALPN